MKTIVAAFLIALAAATFAHADNSRKQVYAADLGPTTLTTTGLTGVVISTVPTNQRNCIEYATFFSTSAYTLYMLDSGTTDYTLTLAASVVHQAPFSEPWCADKGNTLTLRSSTTVSGASYTINYKGFVGQ